jgi:hypothetical protein
VNATVHPTWLVMVLTESQTLVGDRDLSGLVSMAVEAEAAGVPAQLEQGFTSICSKPAMFVDDVAEVGDLCRDLVRRFDLAVAAHSGS